MNLQAAFKAFQQLVRENAIAPAGKPLVLSSKSEGTATDFSFDGSAGPHCEMVVRLIIVVCPAFIH